MLLDYILLLQIRFSVRDFGLFKTSYYANLGDLTEEGSVAVAVAVAVAATLAVPPVTCHLSPVT